MDTSEKYIIINTEFQLLYHSKTNMKSRYSY